jgi:hypothetical protein
VKVLEQFLETPIKPNPKEKYNGMSLYKDTKLFPQSDVQNNKGLNSPKDTGRDNLKRVET